MQSFSWAGVRDDLDLDRCWWHRLAKFVYFSLLALIAFAAVALLALEGEPNYQPRPDYVRITGNLGDVLNVADQSVSDVIPAFLLLPGEHGIQKDGRIERGDWRESYLKRSICTPNAVRHAAAVAAALNERDYTEANTATTVLGSLIDDKGQYPKEARYCWFDSAFREYEIRDVVKYEFTTFGLMRARFDLFGKLFFWLAVAHLLLSNFYYRGVVYVICGPRGKVKEKYLKQQPAPEPEDAGDYIDLDDEVV